MSEQRKQLDEILDKALANYSQAEPRLGLEARVLARLEEEKASPARLWWRWAWVPAAAALLIAGGLYLARPRTQAPPSVAVQSSPPVTAPAPKAAPLVIQATTQAKPRVQPIAAPSAMPAATAVKQPQFPAPHASSEQEKLLLAYVRLQPQAAAQQAQAAGQPLKEINIQPLEIQPLNPDENDQVPQH
jgi:hypothetical protein